MNPIVFLPLTQGKVAVIDFSDFEKVGRVKWYALTSPKSKTIYAARHSPDNHSKVLLLHREILGGLVDHKDGDGLNCLRENLRPASPQQNAANVGLRKDNRSGFKGVSLNSRLEKWQAAISISGKRIYLGVFESPVLAAKAYDCAASKHHKEFAVVNFKD